MIVIALLTFGFVALIQSAFPLWSHHPAAASLRVHLSNGLYANAYVDRLLVAGPPDGRPKLEPKEQRHDIQRRKSLRFRAAAVRTQPSLP